jgi:hypothetical protein
MDWLQIKKDIIKNKKMSASNNRIQKKISFELNIKGVRIDLPD